MTERQLRNAGALAIVGAAAVMTGLAMIWIPLGIVVFGVLLIALAGIVARSGREVAQ